jgi:hypothetical protein
MCIRDRLILLTGLFSCEKNNTVAPEITDVVPTPAKTMIGSKIRFTVNVSNADEPGLIYLWSATCGTFPNGTDTKSVYWQAPDQESDCNITVSVSGEGGTAEHTFSIKVEEPEKPVPPLAGVYYYPWYGGNDFHGRKYLREKLVPVQSPELGEYKDTDPDIIRQHLEWSEYAGIGLWVTSWWGPGRMTDITTKNHILTHPDLNNMQIALFYETSGRMKDFVDDSNVESDIKYIAENYFAHPNYFKIDGRPVLFVYLTRVLARNGNLESTMNLMRGAASEAGYEIYIIGDQVFGKPPSTTDDIALLDGVTNYDVYGSSGGKMYATQEKVDDYYAAQAGWKAKADQVDVSFVPAASPGYNDRGVREGHEPLSRKLTKDDEFGSLFRAMVTEAKRLTDEKTGNLFVITSWNEWHEDTQIEPVAVASPTNKDSSSSGEEYTMGVEYEGYGMKYLDILKELVVITE